MMGKEERWNSKISYVKDELVMEDRIGQLPDDILANIVSRLTLKEAGKTSILSRTWKNSWTFANRLNFHVSETWPGNGEDCEQWSFIMRERSKYVTMVNQVMKNHQGSELDELVIDFQLSVSESIDLDEWITFAFSKRVKALTIDLSHRLDFYYDWGLYEFMSSAPSLPGIECLTSLYLCHLVITEDTIQQLLSVCPHLERLSLKLVYGPVNLRIVGSLFKLKYLNIHNCGLLKGIEIFAPNIVSFSYGAASETKLQVQSICNLVDLHIQGLRRVDEALIQLSNCFSQLETLCMHNFRFSKHFFELDLPQFKNVRHLTLQFPIFNIIDPARLLGFINLFPSLHKFTMATVIVWPLKSLRIEWPDRLLAFQNLKVLEIVGFKKYDCYIKFVRGFLKRAIKLEKLILNIAESSSTDWSKKLKEEMRSGVELLIVT